MSQQSIVPNASPQSPGQNEWLQSRPSTTSSSESSDSAVAPFEQYLREAIEYSYCQEDPAEQLGWYVALQELELTRSLQTQWCELDLVLDSATTTGAEFTQADLWAREDTDEERRIEGRKGAEIDETPLPLMADDLVEQRSSSPPSSIAQFFVNMAFSGLLLIVLLGGLPEVVNFAPSSARMAARTIACATGLKSDCSTQIAKAKKKSRSAQRVRSHSRRTIF